MSAFLRRARRHLSLKHPLCPGLFAALALGTMAGCATVVSGTSQSVSIDTDPPGAACTLSREGKEIAVIDPTPGTVEIDKDKDDIQLHCTKDGYLTSTGTLTSSRQNMAFGNIILGGIVGIGFLGAIVDHASGAARKYPATISLTMIPQRFASEEARKAFFLVMRQQVEHAAEAALEQIDKTCEDEECATQRQAINRLKQLKLDEIARKEAATHVG